MSDLERAVRVLHLVVNLGSGGAEKQLYLLCKNAGDGFRHHVLAVCGGGRWATQLREAGVEVRCLHAPQPGSFRSLVGTSRFLCHLRPEILHCWLPSMNLLGVAAKWLSRCSGIRVIASIRNVDDWKPVWRRSIERLVSNGWDRVICNSWEGRQTAVRQGFEENKLKVIVNGVEPTRGWDREEARRRFNLDSGAFVVACASRLVPQKRLDVVLKAAAELTEVEFVIAGDGPLLDSLCATAPSNVRFLGAIPEPGLLFAAADVFVSVSEREGTSNSLLEALQCGCAVVVTDAGDNLRIAGDAGCETTPTQLGEHLRLLRQQPEELRRMREAARARASAYTVNAMVAGTEQVYSSLTARAPHQLKRVLFLDYTNGIGMGGGQRSLLLLLANLDRTRFQSVLACPPEESWRNLVPAGTRVVDLPMPASFRRLSRFSAGWLEGCLAGASAIGAALHIRRLLAAEHIDLIHANNLKMLLLAALANFDRRIPMVWHVRDILPARSVACWARSIGAYLATRVVTVSRAVARQFSSATELVYNAVLLPDLSDASAQRAQFRQRNGIPAEAFVFGYVGRLDAGKGIDVLLRAFERMGSIFPAVWLVIAGDGPAQTSLMELAAQMPGERVVWSGFEELPGSAFAAMDCAVVPSVEPDSFPRAVIEAMSWARCVIGSTSGGIAEAIIAGETGFVVPAGDVSLLAEKMSILAAAPELALQLGLAGRRVCDERFTVEKQMGQIEALYQDVLAGAAV